ncbi:hypothetical protein GOBAR_AA03347 [Gossypium barbadense]|uniref:Uncharacterized protein n=1 Tax=Gossypium barbadense TaxID=3634 RepID=A0A2P5YNT7_GOSBA|nr:hypothetical protein GOBAR_AA03347 [Gossypium barbadense]
MTRLSFKLVILQKYLDSPRKNVMEPHSNPYHKNRINHEEQRLQIDELDEWRTHVKKKPKAQDDLSNTMMSDPQITTLELNTNGVTPFTVLNVFPYGTVKISRDMAYAKSPRPCDAVVGDTRPVPRAYLRLSLSQMPNAVKFLKELLANKWKLDDASHVELNAPQEELFQILRARPLGVGRSIDCAALEKVHLADALQTMITEYDDPGTVQFRLGSLVGQLTIPKFETSLGLYTDEFMETDHFPHLHRHIHHTPSSCWPFKGISFSSSTAISPCLFRTHINGEAREHWRRQHSRRILLVEHEPLAYFLSRLLCCPCLSPPDRMTPKGSHQHRPICDSFRAIFWAPEYSGTVIIAYSHWLDGPTGHPNFKRFSRWVLLRHKQTIIHDCHVLLDHEYSHHDTDHHDNLFAGHWDCGIQPLQPPSPLSTCHIHITFNASNPISALSKITSKFRAVSILSLSSDIMLILLLSISRH